METQDIAYYISHYSYVGIFLWFFLIDQLTPIPEELVLVTVGYIVHTGLINPFFAGIAALLGLMLVDNIYFLLAYKSNKWTQKLKKKQRGKVMNKFQEKLRKNQISTLFLIAFIPKVRFFGPIIAGLSKISHKRFFIVNMCASSIYVALYLTLGIFFHNTIEHVIHKLELQQHAVFGIFILIMAISISLLVNKWLND